MNHPTEFADLFKLPIEERIQLAHDLWDSAEAEQQAATIPTEVLAELLERKARYDANPASGIPWGEVQRRLREDGCAS